MNEHRRTPTVTVNGRDYRFPPLPTVVVCIDGSEPGYIEKGDRGRACAQSRPAHEDGDASSREFRHSELHQPQ